MNAARNNAHPTNEFVERALARVEQIDQIARELTEAFGLPQDSCYTVLSSLTPFLLEELYKREREESAPSDE